MFPGMMDPELIKLAQEQMGRMSPAELARIQQQMMSNPELMRMASESMKNLRPEDLRMAAEQLNSTRPEEMAEIGEKMANASPEDIAAMRSRLDAQISYEISAAQMLKRQGNELHSQGRFSDASQKYLLAKKNLKDVPISKGRTLLTACSLNLMSCYLKTRQYDDCIKEGTEVLAIDGNNVKALYRRGQAYKALGQLEVAVSDLTKALELSPDETISDVLRDAKRILSEQGAGYAQDTLRIEEIIEEVPSLSAKDKVSSTEVSMAKPEEINKSSNQHSRNNGVPSTSSDYLHALKDDPESVRSFQNFISQADSETLAYLGGGKAEGISPDMVKTASDVISKMPPEELQRMLQLASSFQGENPLFNRDSSGSSSNNFSPGSAPTNMTPDMFKMAADMMSKMSAEELRKMFEMTSSLNGKISAPVAAPVHSNGFRSNDISEVHGSREASTLDADNISERNPFQGSLNSRSASQASFPSSSSNMQEQMRNQLKDPAMRQMLSSMMKNMSPDVMANMSEQFGFKLSPEDAEKAQQAMSSFSPESLDKMMRWADRIQRTVEGARRTKNWLLGRQGMVLAVFMLLLAVILHRLGYIGY